MAVPEGDRIALMDPALGASARREPILPTPLFFVNFSGAGSTHRYRAGPLSFDVGPEGRYGILDADTRRGFRAPLQPDRILLHIRLDLLTRIVGREGPARREVVVILGVFQSVCFAHALVLFQPK